MAIAFTAVDKTSTENRWFEKLIIDAERVISAIQKPLTRFEDRVFSQYPRKAKNDDR
jgi:hypothetical protein